MSTRASISSPYSFSPQEMMALQAHDTQFRAEMQDLMQRYNIAGVMHYTIASPLTIQPEGLFVGNVLTYVFTPDCVQDGRRGLARLSVLYDTFKDQVAVVISTAYNHWLRMWANQGAAWAIEQVQKNRLEAQQSAEADQQLALLTKFDN
jgi:hypothetical protein